MNEYPVDRTLVVRVFLKTELHGGNKPVSTHKATATRITFCLLSMIAFPSLLPFFFTAPIWDSFRFQLRFPANMNSGVRRAEVEGAMGAAACGMESSCDVEGGEEVVA